jgi:hypothetical protein
VNEYLQWWPIDKRSTSLGDILTTEPKIIQIPEPLFKAMRLTIASMKGFNVLRPTTVLNNIIVCPVPQGQSGDGRTGIL